MQKKKKKIMKKKTKKRRKIGWFVYDPSKNPHDRYYFGMGHDSRLSLSHFVEDETKEHEEYTKHKIDY